MDRFEEWEKKYLPSREVGLLVISSPNGVLSHKEAREKRIGGRLLAFIY
jgi:small subunit ribosomal protein S8